MVGKIIILILGLLLPLSAILYPYMGGMVLKARSLRKLRETARGVGFKYRRFYKNIFFVRNGSRKYDMIIYNGDTLYAVKLWSSYFKRAELCVTKNARYFERREVSPVLETGTPHGKRRYIKGFSHKAVATRLPKRYLRGNRKIVSVLLIYPSYKNIFVHDGTKMIPLGTMDELFGKIIYSPSALTKEILEKDVQNTQKASKNAEKE